MKKELFDSKWQFNFNWTSRTVDLPHDYSVEQKRDEKARGGGGNGFFPGGNAEYRKIFNVPADWKGKKVMLEFEGVYMNATVRVNSQQVAFHPYGYTSFHADLTPFLHYDKDNTVSVNVANDSMPNTRWYSGSGIYRHVWLLTADGAYIEPWGVFVSTPDVNTVKIETTSENNLCCGVTLRNTVLNANSTEISSAEVDLTAGKNKTVQELKVIDPKLWSPNSPYLYTLVSEIIADGKVIDTVKTPFGIRMIEVDAVNGFRLNGKTIKMKGGCVHHDCGILGSAAFDRAEERKVELLKASGYDATRCAHNPPSPAFLDACDRLGMLVIDESFDCWDDGKNPFDYNLHFRDWWKRDTESMILRDRNHPSVVIWSTGNEIIERDGRSNGYKVAKALADYTRELDPTRPVTNALCMLWGEQLILDELKEAGIEDTWGHLTREFAEPLSIVGYNYLRDRYEEDGKKFPGRIIAGTETFPKESFEYWELVEKLPYVIGDFVWTSWDYLGESNIGWVKYKDSKGSEQDEKGLPDQARCGDIDVCGFKRPQSYYRDFVWGADKAPYIAVHKPYNHGKEMEISWWGYPDVVQNWNWDGYEGKPIEIDVYASGDEAELFINGESLGRKPVGKANAYKARFETVYAPGELTAVTYEKGAEKYRASLKTVGAPVSIKLTPDRSKLSSSNSDLSFVTVEVLDAEGNLVPFANNEIFFSVNGAGVLQAFGSGKHNSEEMYTTGVRRVFQGKAMAVVRTNGCKGAISLTASAQGLASAQTDIEAV